VPQLPLTRGAGSLNEGLNAFQEVYLGRSFLEDGRRTVRADGHGSHHTTAHTNIAAYTAAQLQQHKRTDIIAAVKALVNPPFTARGLARIHSN